jgi:hypothetical protein
VGLADKIRIMRGHLTPEEVAERDAAARRRREAAEQQEEAQQRYEQEQAAAAQRSAQRYDQERATFRRWMQRSAAISSVELVCHSDLWTFIERKTQIFGPRTFTKTPTSLAEGRCSIKLSGPELARVLDVMGDVTMYGMGNADRAIAVQVRRTIGKVVDQIDPDQPARAIPQIVIDAGVARREDDKRPAGTPAPRA